MGPDRIWPVIILSDAQKAKEHALRAALGLGLANVRLQASAAKPAHSDFKRSPGRWSPKAVHDAFVDLAAMAASSGIVHHYYLVGGQSEVSTYTGVAKELGLLPLRSLRLAKKRCTAWPAAVLGERALCASHFAERFVQGLDEQLEEAERALAAWLRAVEERAEDSEAPPVVHRCPESLHAIGKAPDDAYHCLALEDRRGHCDFVSVGAADGRWALEGAMFRETGCRTHVFDCGAATDAASAAAAVPPEISARTSLDTACLGERPEAEGRELLDWSALLARAGLAARRAPDYLRLDLRAGPGPLRALLRGGLSLAPPQLALVLGSGPVAEQLPLISKDSGGEPALMPMLFEAGYRLLHVGAGGCAAGCTQLLLARLFC